MKIVVIGGTGLIGKPLVEELRALGHEVVAASPSGIDASSGKSLDQTLAGARVVIDVANWPSYEDAIALSEAETRGLDQASCDLMVDSFLRHGRIRLQAETDAGIGHHVAMTLVGAERMRDSSYMRAKIALEELVQGAGLPYTIVRTTPFFEAMRETADLATEVDSVVRVPSVDLQPIAAKDVAHAICEVAISEPANGFVEIAGPDRLKFDQVVRRVLDAHSDPREVVGEVHARYFGTEMTDTSMVPGPDARLGRTSFDEWVGAVTRGRLLGGDT